MTLHDGSCSTAVSDPFSVTQFSAVDVIPNEDNVSICAGESVNLEMTVNGTTNYTGNWTDADGLGNETYLSSTTNDTTTFTPTSGGTYNFDYTVTDNTSGCTGVGTVTIFVSNNLPGVDAGPDVTICPGGAAQLGTTDTSNYTYSWSPTMGLNELWYANGQSKCHYYLHFDTKQRYLFGYG